MSVDVLPASARRAGSDELPAEVAGWTLTRITSGLWLSASGRDAAPNVLALTAESGRLAVVVDAVGPDSRTDELISELFPVLVSTGRDRLRLVLSCAADRYAAIARSHGIDLIAADAEVVITPGGYAVVRARRPSPAGSLPQWRRLLADGDQPAGALFPSPAWEQRLADRAAAFTGQRVRRVPAGLALQLGGPDGGVAADAVWPDPERVTIVVDGAAPGDEVRRCLAALLPLLPREATDGVRLYWPRAGVGPAVQQLASECGTDLIAPAADISACDGFGAVCHGPAGAAPWLRFGDGPVEMMGSVYPVPAWETSLAVADLSGLAGKLLVDDVAAGLCLYRPGRAARGLTMTARSIVPEFERATILVGGDASLGEVRQDVEDLIRLLPAAATASLRLVLVGAGRDGADSFAQYLADVFGIHVIAPADRWTATPDGRLKALSPSAQAGGWREFSPRRPDALPVEPVVPAEPVLPVAPEEVPQTAQPSPAPAVSIRLFARDHRSSEQERLTYRESAVQYQSHAVSVRRMLTQRPGLRAAAAGDSDEAVMTDFAAVLDFLGDEPRGAAAALRSQAGDDPRIACVISGLRRLPSFTGVVYSAASLPPGATGGYVTGAVLIEPAFVRATSSARVALDGNAQYVIWSQTGKRIAALASDAARDEIIFAAGTEYKVLQVVASSTSGQATVFLRECQRRRGEPPTEPFDDMDAIVLERLTATAALRDEAAGYQMATQAGNAGPPIGLDSAGAPFPRG
jgi:hypothetical protein